MNFFLNIRYLLFVTIFSSSVANAGVFISVAPGWVFIDTVASTRPLVADIRFGYEIDEHQLELATMSSLKEDNLNQLTVDVSSVNSLFYRYSPYYEDRLKIHLILGVSQIDVDSTYPTTPDTTDSFDGVSYGIGIEEDFETIPELKLKFDWMQLYRGDQLNINLMSLGLRYEF